MRRQSRLTRGGSSIAFQPSGVTISGAGIDCSGKGINFGQGSNKLIYSGSTPIGTNKTSLSAGTISLLTGLAAVESFTFGIESATTPGHPNMPDTANFQIDAGKAGGVTIFFCSQPAGLLTGVTHNTTLLAGGTTLNWQAVGT